MIFILGLLSNAPMGSLIIEYTNFAMLVKLSTYWPRIPLAFFDNFMIMKAEV